MTKLATRPTFTVGQHINRAGDVFHRQWTVLAVDGPTITVGQDDGYEETLTATALTTELATPAAPAYYLDVDDVLWQTTADGRYRKWQAADHIWGPVEDADWVAEVLDLTPLA